jgi:hypothetical protein
MPRSNKMPRFEPEAEEADWYAAPAGRRQTQCEFERAIKTGALTANATGLKIAAPIRRRSQRCSPERSATA